MKKKLVVFLIVLAMIIIALGIFLSVVHKTQNKNQQNSQIANPASVYCKNHDGKLEIKTDSKGNQQGICVFTDGHECDEWAYYRGECK